MKSNHAWLLLGIAAVLYALWQVNQEPAAITPSAAVAVTDHPDLGREAVATLDRLEQRIVMLEERLQRLESSPAGIAPATDEMLAGLSARVDLLEQDYSQHGSSSGLETQYPTERRTELFDAQGTQSAVAMADNIRDAFESDDIPEPALQVELENAEYLFDSPRIDALAYREMDCRLHYCRLGYEDQSEDSTDAALLENELFVLLTRKYGDNITIHAGERNGTYRSIYIELAD